MGSSFHLRKRLKKKDACRCLSRSKCLLIKKHTNNIVSETPKKEEEPAKETQKKEEEPPKETAKETPKEEEEPAEETPKEEEPGKEEIIKLPIMNIELLNSRAGSSFPEGLPLEELYEFLKNPFVFDDNKRKLWIDEESLKSWLIVSAKALAITWGNDPRYWKWISVEKSSFGEVAKLDDVCWFEVTAKIECGFLSPATNYRVSFRVKFEGLFGWDEIPAKISLSTTWGFRYESGRFLADLNKPVGIEGLADATFRVEEDGWVELDAGCFEIPENVGEGTSSVGEVEVSITHLTDKWKGGVLIDCVKVVPVKPQQGSA